MLALVALWMIGEIDAHDIFQICKSADAPVGAFGKAVAEVVSGLEAPIVPGCGQDVRDVLDRILVNSKPRIEVLGRYLGSAG